MPFEQGEAIPFVQPDPPVRAFYLASVGGGGPVNLVLLGLALELDALMNRFRLASRKLFNHFFRIDDPYNNKDAWTFEFRNIEFIPFPQV